MDEATIRLLRDLADAVVLGVREARADDVRDPVEIIDWVFCNIRDVLQESLPEYQENQARYKAREAAFLADQSEPVLRVKEALARFADAEKAAQEVSPETSLTKPKETVVQMGHPVGVIGEAVGSAFAALTKPRT